MIKFPKFKTNENQRSMFGVVILGMLVSFLGAMTYYAFVSSVILGTISLFGSLVIILAYWKTNAINAF